MTLRESNGSLIWENVTIDDSVYVSVRYYSYQFVLPAICLIGALGNILNIYIFSRGRFCHALDQIERSATTGLVALAISDLLFCLVLFPYPFLSGRHVTDGTQMGLVKLFYTVYKVPVTNVLIMSSAWLTVEVAAERYIAVCHPFQSRYLIRVSRTIIGDVIIYVASILLNIPHFLQFEIHSIPCGNQTKCYFTMISDLYMIGNFERYYDGVWICIGAFLPLTLLSCCNIRLTLEIYRSHSRLANDKGNQRHSNVKITTILMAIVLMYTILMTPSMVLNFIQKVVFNQVGGHRTQTAIVITNMLQALNFAGNFMLYCTISKPFRESIQGKLCKLSSSRNSTDTNNHRYELVKKKNGPNGQVNLPRVKVSTP